MIIEIFNPPHNKHNTPVSGTRRYFEQMKANICSNTRAEDGALQMAAHEAAFHAKKSLYREIFPLHNQSPFVQPVCVMSLTSLVERKTQKKSFRIAPHRIGP